MSSAGSRTREIPQTHDKGRSPCLRPEAEPCLPKAPGTMTELITAVDAVDVRFPTSQELDGSDAMNPEPDYSAAYVTVRTSGGEEGFGLAFTVGRGNDVQVAAIRALAPLVVGLPVTDLLGDLRGFSERLTG